MVHEHKSAGPQSTHKEALTEFLKVFTPDGRSGYIELGERLTCEGAEALAGLFGAHGHRTTAQLWLEAHQPDCMGALGRHRTVYDSAQRGAFLYS